jgi:hypothetical protein
MKDGSVTAKVLIALGKLRVNPGIEFLLSL